MTRENGTSPSTDCFSSRSVLSYCGPVRPRGTFARVLTCQRHALPLASGSTCRTGSSLRSKPTDEQAWTSISADRLAGAKTSFECSEGIAPLLGAPRSCRNPSSLRFGPDFWPTCFELLRTRLRPPWFLVSEKAITPSKTGLWHGCISSESSLCLSSLPRRTILLCKTGQSKERQREVERAGAQGIVDFPRFCRHY
jgi:hypothetical protein